MDKEITTIQISTELRNELNKLKYNYGFKTIEEVIRHYIKFRRIKWKKQDSEI